ncbi:peptidoglycan binding protein CsiV [Shewanella salipaludis]|nr:peptidoglycan binding protein CsiV [Shewanella salipaludis]
MSIVTLAALSAQTWAREASEEAWFEVEVYVFARQAPSTEQWPELVAPAKASKRVDLITPRILIPQSIAAFGSGQTEAELQAPQTLESQPARQAQSMQPEAGMLPEQQLLAEQQAQPVQADCVADESTPSTCAPAAAVIHYSYPSRVPVSVAASSPQYAVQGGPPVLLAESQGQFQDIMAKLAREPGNTSLLHMSWQQNMQPRHRAVPVRLFAGRNFAAEFEANGLPRVTIPAMNDPDSLAVLGGDTENLAADSRMPLNGDTPAVIDMPAVADMPETPAPVWQLDGDINIYLSHYLYIETALNLREEVEKWQLPATQLDGQAIQAPATAQPPEAQQQTVPTPFLASIPLVQNRRVKSGEIHYFDHPRMGIVMQIRKMAPPSIQETDQETDREPGTEAAPAQGTKGAAGLL